MIQNPLDRIRRSLKRHSLDRSKRKNKQQEDERHVRHGGLMKKKIIVKLKGHPGHEKKTSPYTPTQKKSEEKENGMCQGGVKETGMALP
jgi:hypothetical protein